MSRFVGRPSESHCRLSLLSDTHHTPARPLDPPPSVSGRRAGRPTSDDTTERRATPRDIGRKEESSRLNVPREALARPFHFGCFDIDDVPRASPRVCTPPVHGERRRRARAQLAAAPLPRVFPQSSVSVFPHSSQTKKRTLHPDDARRSRLLRARCCPPSRPCALARFAALGGQRNPCGSRKHCHSARASAAAH